MSCAVSDYVRAYDGNMVVSLFVLARRGETQMMDGSSARSAGWQAAALQQQAAWGCDWLVASAAAGRCGAAAASPPRPDLAAGNSRPGAHARTRTIASSS